MVSIGIWELQQVQSSLKMASTMLVVHILTMVSVVITMVTCLDNGLARTPPLGWLSWERFECNTNCEIDPDRCIGERLVRLQADAMVAEGYRDAGYEYLTLDDCWPDYNRDPEGNIIPDPKRFPSGMKALADYVHNKGLKLGLYACVGRHTCAGFPGSQHHIDQDAKTFASWGIDMVKFDGCNVDPSFYKIGYPAMGKALNKTGRPIMYSCEWPLYDRSSGIKPDYPLVAETCNTWRVYGDIYDAWQSITSIVNWYGDDKGNFSAVVRPGAFNDADMITLGNFGLSRDQERVQMGLWSMFASPLLMSVDLRNVRPSSKALLQNRRVLAINQDPLAIQAKRMVNLDNGMSQVYTRPVVPKGSIAVAYVNMREYGYPILMSFAVKSLGLTNQGGYNISEVFDGFHIGYFKPGQSLTARVNPNGIFLVKAVPL